MSSRACSLYIGFNPHGPAPWGLNLARLPSYLYQQWLCVHASATSPVESTPEARATLTVEDEEAALMLRISDGDPGAYRILVDRHLRSVHRFAHRLLGNRSEAEEVAQETFLRLWKHARTYSPRAKVKSWLFKIAHNLAVDVLRRRRELVQSAVDEQPASGQPGLRLEQKRQAEAVRRALDQLPQRQRAAIVLAHYEGQSNPEVADILGIRVRAVESLLARGRRQLKSLLAEAALDQKELP